MFVYTYHVIADIYIYIWYEVDRGGEMLSQTKVFAPRRHLGFDLRF